MKNWKKIFTIIAIVVIIFSLAYAFFLMEAKNIIARNIEAASGHRTTIGKLDIKPPLNLEIRDLEIVGLLKAGYIYVSPSIPNLLFGRIALNKVKIVGPQLTYQRIPELVADNSPASVETGPIVATAPVTAPATEAMAQNKNFSIIRYSIFKINMKKLHNYILIL